MKKIRKYFPFMKAGLHQATAYKLNWMFIICGNIIGCFVSFYLWKAVFEAGNTPTFMGFNINEMTTYIFITFITKSIIGSGATDDIGEEIKDGSIVMRMIKPISYNATFIFQEIGEKIVKIVLVFIPITIGLEIYKYLVFGVLDISLLRIGMYICSLILAYFINTFFNISYGFTAFYFKNLWGSRMLKDCLVNFMSGSIIPLNFLPDILENIFVILPFSYINYVPVMIYMGKYTGKEAVAKILLQLCWCLAFWLLSKSIWRIASKHLCVQGG